jgi:hypothetical protein
MFILSKLDFSSSQTKNREEMSCQIFISVRFAEAGIEANALKSALDARGISTFLCAVHPGGDIRGEIVNALSSSQLAIVMGTKSYGENTGAGFCTYEELEFIYDEKKPFFLVKMCDKFDVNLTRFLVRKSVSYLEWFPRSPMPDDLVTKILEKLASTTVSTNSVSSELNEKLPSPLPSSATIPLESLNPNESIELLIHLGCSAELRKKVKELNLEIDGGYLQYLHEIEVLQELEGVKNNIRIPVLKGILNKLKKFQENGIPPGVLNEVKNNEYSTTLSSTTLQLETCKMKFNEIHLKYSIVKTDYEQLSEKLQVTINENSTALSELKREKIK